MSSYVPMEFVLGSVCFIVMQLAECFDISRSGQGLFFPRFLCLQVFNFSDTVLFEVLLLLLNSVQFNHLIQP